MNKHFFDIAKQESKKSDYIGASSARIGAVLVYHGTIIARGCNSNETHPLQQLYNRKYRYDDTCSNNYLPSKIHAELDCCMKARWTNIDWERAELYIYRENKNGKLAMARPCEACWGILKEQFHIKKVCYTTENGYCEEKIKY